MNTTVGEKLEQYFDYLGYNYHDLDAALGLNRQDADLIFSNKLEVTNEQLADFASLFNTTVDILSNGKSLDEEAKTPDNLDMTGFTENDKLEIGKFTSYLSNKK